MNEQNQNAHGDLRATLVHVFECAMKESCDDFFPELSLKITGFTREPKKNYDGAWYVLHMSFCVDTEEFHLTKDVYKGECDCSLYVCSRGETYENIVCEIFQFVFPERSCIFNRTRIPSF